MTLKRKTFNNDPQLNAQLFPLTPCVFKFNGQIQECFFFLHLLLRIMIYKMPLIKEFINKEH